MTIIPIFRREMVAAARQRRLYAERRAIASMLFLVVGGSFAAWWYWAGGVLDGGTMARISDEALRWCVAMQGGIAGSILIRGALSIARERESRTLDFLVATPLSGAEIVLGKLASCVALTVGTMGVGLPIVLLLHSLVGVDPRLIGLMYAALAAMGVFLGAMAIWVSAETPDRRLAGVAFLVLTMGWLIGPFSLTVFLPRWGLRLPEWLAAANWWLVESSPVLIVLHIAAGLRSWDHLVDEVGRMMALQAGAAVLFTAAAIVRLRPAYRALAGLARPEDRKARRRLVWRWRPRPAVGDDPILWREKYTSRDGGLVKAFTAVVWGSLTIALVAATFNFAHAAFIEVGKNGFDATATPPTDLEMNVLVRLVVAATATGPDAARLNFNVFLRWTSISILFMTSIVAAAFAFEAIAVERTKSTWTSLLATPMSGREILRAAILAALWRTRLPYLVVLILWGLGLASGALHPLGVMVAAMIAAAWAWLLFTFGALEAVLARKDGAGATRALPAILLLSVTGVLPWSLPPGLDSVLWGAGCLPLMLWSSLVSYREAAMALAHPLDPGLPWLIPLGGQMPLLVAAAWLVAIVIPAVAGWWAWRYATTHFDRLVGRPHRPPQVQAAPVVPARRPPHPRDNPTHPGCPLAEAERAV